MKLFSKNSIYKSDDRNVLYHSVIRCPDGIVRMYINQWVGFHQTYYLESMDDGMTFEKEKHVFVKGSGISHNFYPFIDKDNNLKGIGGVDSWKHEQRWRLVDDYEEFKTMFFERFKTPYTRDAERFETFKQRIRSKKHLDQTSGLYYLDSKDCKKWTIQEEPCFDVHNNGYWSMLANKSAEFDGHISLVYMPYNETYYLFLRKNVRFGIRFIQVATSKDLVHWEKMQEIKVDKYNINNENYYSPVIMKHPTDNCFFGLIPFFYEKDNKYASIRLLKSIDGVTFENKKDLFEGTSILLKNKPKNRQQFVNGYIQNGDILSFYVHHNYLGIAKREAVEIVRYEITVKDFEAALK